MSRVAALWPIGFALFAAGLLPIQAALAGALNRALRQPPLVVLISLTGSLMFIVVVGLVTGRLFAPTAERVAAIPPWALPAGVCGAIFLLSQPVVLPRVGAAVYIGCSVTAQIVVAIALDHFGVLQLPSHPATPLRLLGAALMVAGIVLVART